MRSARSTEHSREQPPMSKPEVTAAPGITTNSCRHICCQVYLPHKPHRQLPLRAKPTAGAGLMVSKTHVCPEEHQVQVKTEVQSWTPPHEVSAGRRRMESIHSFKNYALSGGY